MSVPVSLVSREAFEHDDARVSTNDPKIVHVKCEVNNNDTNE